MAASMKNDKGYGTIAVSCPANSKCTVSDDELLHASGLRGVPFHPVQEVHMQGGYCSVDWDNGTHDRCLFTGQQQVLVLSQ